MKDILRWVVYSGLFLVPGVVLIVANSMFFPYITGKNFAFRIIVEIVFASWIVLALYEPVYRPKWSWILASFLAFLGVMFIANIFGEYPFKSFWSGFERMEGYVTLVHVFLYFVVLASMLKTKELWDRFLNTTLFFAGIVILYAFAQLSGDVAITQGGVRLDGTLGNSAFMAVYMLFMIFFSAIMFVRTEGTKWRYAYLAIIPVFGFLLLQTATRGAILGCFGGIVVAGLYVAFFARKNKVVQFSAGGVLLALVLFAGLFFAFRDSAFVQNDERLARIGNISLKEGAVRFEIWSMAFEGVKEQPFLGRGQGSYDYVFNKHYRPSLYAQEAWFDRAHNIVMEWLVSGGVIGAFFYFSILGSALFYLIVRPLFTPYQKDFTVLERGLLLGLLAGYLFHNLFVFDNIVSYIFYATVLAYIHSRIGIPFVRLESWKIPEKTVSQVVFPVMFVVLCGTVYMVNVPGIQAAQDLLLSLRSEDPEVRYAYLQSALERKAFGRQEIREQMLQFSIEMVNDPSVPKEVAEEILPGIEAQLIRQTEVTPKDARAYVFLGLFYRVTGDFDKAVTALEKARTLSPKKQLIIFDQGITYIQKKEYERAHAYFKEAYDLAPSFGLARVYYAASGLYLGKNNLIEEIINSEALWEQFVTHPFSAQVAYEMKNYQLLQRIFEGQIALFPKNSEPRVNLAAIYYEQGNITKAIEILEQAIKDIPTFENDGKQIIREVRRSQS